jgi:hypothetical protein
VQIPKTTMRKPNFSMKSDTKRRDINESSRIVSQVAKAVAGISIVVALLTASLSAGAVSHSGRLSPAPDLPVGHACTHALVHDADGNVTPLLCSPTRFNVQAWRWYAKNSFVPVLALPRRATLSDVEGALCRVQNSTAAMRYSEFQLARAYNDWRFSQSPITLWETNGCG